ncbi:MAG: GIY-YIG nuclease family protein [Dehalococcoidia bacterium]|nr:GIY-YIG nuclease family protein [Dehalococcoidia bacterium]
MERDFYVYIMTTAKKTVLYVGMTNDLVGRVHQHRARSVPGFTRCYNVDKLAYYELHPDAYSTITREKQLKAGPRSHKVALINSMNPEWRDLWADSVL